LRDELGESFCHAVELQRVQRLVGGVSKGVSFGQWKNCGPRMLAWGIGGASGG
jgi:Leu/Phe-tRNA-protein transferase